MSLCQSGKATSKRRVCERATHHECARPGFCGTSASRAGAYKSQDFDFRSPDRFAGLVSDGPRRGTGTIFEEIDHV
jgi:hypothetical protein